MLTNLTRAVFQFLLECIEVEYSPRDLRQRNPLLYGLLFATSAMEPGWNCVLYQ